MNDKGKMHIHRVNTFLNKPISIILVLVLLSGHFGYQNAQVQRDNRKILQGIEATSKNTNAIVDKQDETLQAIKQAAEDARLTAEQKANLIICMIQVPQSQRTPDFLTNCRKQAVADTSTSASSKPNTTSTNASPQPSKAPPSSQSAPQNANGQSNKPLTVTPPIVPPCLGLGQLQVCQGVL